MSKTPTQIKQLAQQCNITLLVTDSQLSSINWGTQEKDDNFKKSPNTDKWMFIDQATNKPAAEGLLLNILTFIDEMQS